MTQVLWNKEIEQISSSGYLNEKISITDALIENFYNEILKDEEKTLLKLVFSKNPSQKDLDKLLEKWDIEVKGANKSLMLSYFMKRHPHLQFTNYEGPRLAGLFNYLRFSNLKVIGHYKKIGKALNQAGIIPIIIKGGVMKYLRPEYPRVMGDIDIVVPEKDFMKSAQVAVGIGYEYKKAEPHSIDIHEKGSEAGTMDIHRYINMDTGYERKFLDGLFKRAHEEDVFGIKTLVPCFEDLMFISLVNLARNLRDKTSQAGLLYTVFDCKFFLENKQNFDWKIVKENATKTRTEVQINFAMKFIQKISADILPDNLYFEKETNDYSNMVMFNRFYLEDIRTECRAMKIKDLFKNPKMLGKYILLKPKYQLLKGLKKHPRLIEIFIKDLKTKTYDFTK